MSLYPNDIPVANNGSMILLSYEQRRLSQHLTFDAEIAVLLKQLDNAYSNTFFTDKTNTVPISSFK